MTLLHLSIIYKLYAFVNAVYHYVSDTYKIVPVLHSDGFLTILRKYLRCEFRIDWLGRVYGVVNPHINMGESDLSSSIIEFNGDRTNDTEYVRNWLVRQMSLVGSVYGFDRSHLFEYVAVDIVPVGTPGYDNYLITFDLLSRKTLTYRLKRLLLQTVLYGILCTIGYLIYTYI